MHVRRASVLDLPEILPLARAFHAESPYHREFAFDDDKVEQLITAASTDPAWCALVVADDDGIFGLALFFAAEMFFSRALEAADLTFYVAPAKRGTRAAFRLMQQVREWAEMRGCAKLSVAPNTGINHDATARFLEKLGFQQRAFVFTLAL